MERTVAASPWSWPANKLCKEMAGRNDGRQKQTASDMSLGLRMKTASGFDGWL